MNDNSKVLAALLAGIAAGAAIGLLFAPEKGTDTRDKLNDSLRNLADSIKERASDEISNLKDAKNRMADNLKSKFSTAEDQVNTAGGKARSAFDDAADSTENNFNQA
jgi:gas vesicle protein